MKKMDFFKTAIVGMIGGICISGQTARKDVQEISSTQYTAEVDEVQEELEYADFQAQAEDAAPKLQEHKSAARRAMEGPSQATMRRKSAAQRAMELEH